MSTRDSVALQMEDLSIGYGSGSDSCAIKSHINIELKKGEMVCLVGPNGCGKSTLLRTIAGLQPVLAGKVTISGRDIRPLASQELAHLRSVVLTNKFDAGYMTVTQLVSLGRFPHLSWMGRLGANDIKQVDNAMALTGISHLNNRRLNKLSDGELQRAMIAKALAQESPVILLDEPTAHLDLPNRVAVIKLLLRLAKETSTAIVLSTHELDLAMQSADRFWLMYVHDEIRCEMPEFLALSGDISRAFNSDNVHFDSANGSFVMHKIHKGIVALSGDGAEYLWTKKLLERTGFSVGESSVAVTVKSNKGIYSWLVWKNNTLAEAESMEVLVSILTK